MANEPIIIVTGFLGGDAEYRKTPNGVSVTNLNLANTPRKNVNNEWVDGETSWFRVMVWNREAAGVASALHKGDKVLVLGRLIQETYVDKEGNERKSLQINADTVGVVPKIIPDPVNPVSAGAVEDPVGDDFPW